MKRALAKSYLLISLLPPRNSLEIMGLYRGWSSQLEYNGLDCLCRTGYPQLAGANEIGKLMEIHRKSLALAPICPRNGAMYGTSGVGPVALYKEGESKVVI